MSHIQSTKNFQIKGLLYILIALFFLSCSPTLYLLDNSPGLAGNIYKKSFVEKIKKELLKNNNYKAVLITHNESSSGVRNPLKEICEVIKDNSNALILVDAVSSAAGTRISTDGWGIDIVATASQKSWIAPPGIAMISGIKFVLRQH